eukprot:6157683-Pyramimonas_sp.AAC.1
MPTLLVALIPLEAFLPTLLVKVVPAPPLMKLAVPVLGLFLELVFMKLAVLILAPLRMALVVPTMLFIVLVPMEGV